MEKPGMLTGMLVLDKLGADKVYSTLYSERRDYSPCGSSSCTNPFDATA